MEDYYTSLSQTGLNLEEAARGGSVRSCTRRNRYSQEELGSPEYIEWLKRTQQVVARTSFRHPKNAGDSGTDKTTTKKGAKFEHLGKTPYSLSGSSKASIRNGGSSCHDQSNNSGKECNRSVANPAGKPKVHGYFKAEGSSRTINERPDGAKCLADKRNSVSTTDTEDGSSDELNLTSSSQPIESPRRSFVDAASGPSESDSDNDVWQRNLKSRTSFKQASFLSSEKSKPRSLKSRPRNDENSFSDETPEKKKPKVKPRTAYGTTMNNPSDCSAGGGYSSRNHASKSSQSGDLSPIPTETTTLKGARSRSPYQPSRTMLEQKKTGEETPCPKTFNKGKSREGLASFPMTKEDRSVCTEISSRDKPKIELAPFPLSKESGTSSVAAHNSSHVRDTKAVYTDSDDSGSDNDPLLMNSNDHIILRGGLAPFPMSSQDRPSNFRKPSAPLQGAGLRISESEIDLKQRPKDMRRESNKFFDAPEIADCSFTQPNDGPDPHTLCPYCDRLFPPNPTPLLLDMLKRIPKYPDARPTNPLGLKAPLLSYVSMCQRHQFEMQLLPTAQAAGWPTHIDFVALPKRIRALRQRLAGVLHKKEKSIFWSEVKRDIDKQGARKTMSISNQFDSFEKSQPGYYGEQGAVVISQTLSNLFPPDTIDTSRVAPLTPAEFIRCILVPECAVSLIQEDLGRETDIEYAIRTLRESSKYGTAMFPDLDNRDATNLGEGYGGGQQIGDAILEERARLRRMEIRELEGPEEIPEGSDKRDGRTCTRKGCLSYDNGTESIKGKGVRERGMKTKSSGHGRERRGTDLIDLSDSSAIRTDASVQNHTHNKTSDTSAQPKNSSKQRVSRTGLTAVKPRSRSAAGSKDSSVGICSAARTFSNDFEDAEEATPRPTARIYREPYESDSGIVLPEEDNRYETFSRKKTTSSSLSLKLNSSFRPLQMANEREARKDVIFKTTVSENEAESEIDESDSLVSSFDSRRASGNRSRGKSSSAKTNSHSWLWSNSNTPSATPSE